MPMNKFDGGRPSCASRAQHALRPLAAALAFVFILSFGEAAYAFKCDRVPDAPPRDVSSPRNLGVLKLRLHRYACSDRHDQAIARVVVRAQAYLERRAPRVAKPAMVLDIDETSLSNWPAILANDFGYIPDGPCDALPKGPCGWHGWELLARAEAIQPTLKLFNAAKAKGVSVFFITGRRDAPERRASTEKNLRAAGYDGWTGLVMRAPGDAKLAAVEFKSKERAKIAKDGYTIIVNVGDQRSDLDGGYAERRFLVPNPFYYIK